MCADNEKSRTFAASFIHPKLSLVGSNALIFGRKGINAQKSWNESEKDVILHALKKGGNLLKLDKTKKKKKWIT